MPLSLENLRYPIGRFTPPSTYSEAAIAAWIETLAVFPSDLRKVAEKLSEQQLETPYRPEGWTIRQTIHHVADSHINAFTRFKLALTEDKPNVKGYEEQLWALLDDGQHAPIDWSLDLLEALHKRWVMLLKSMTAEQWLRTYYHPQNQKEVELRTVLALYAWHCKHHLAHVLAV